MSIIAPSTSGLWTPHMVTWRKYIGKLAMFGERVLARLPANGEKDRRADFHIVLT